MEVGGRARRNSGLVPRRGETLGWVRGEGDQGPGSPGSPRPTDRLGGDRGIKTLATFEKDYGRFVVGLVRKDAVHGDAA